MFKKFEENNATITLNVLYTKKAKIYTAYVSKHNPNPEKQVILLMNSNREKGRWHYLAVKKLSALLRRMASKHHDDFYSLNCFHSFATEKKTSIQ